MHVYNCIHVWQAARVVKNPPANNYGFLLMIQLKRKKRTIR